MINENLVKLGSIFVRLSRIESVYVKHDYSVSCKNCYHVYVRFLDGKILTASCEATEEKAFEVMYKMMEGHYESNE